MDCMVNWNWLVFLYVEFNWNFKVKIQGWIAKSFLLIKNDFYEGDLRTQREFSFLTEYIIKICLCKHIV